MLTHLPYTQNVTDSLPQTIEREDGRKMRFTACVALDEVTQREYSTPIRVESIYEQIGNEKYYHCGGARRPRLDIVNSIDLDEKVISQARTHGIDLFNPEDLLGTCFVRRDKFGKTISLDEINHTSNKNYRRVIDIDAAPNLFMRRELQRGMARVTEIEKTQSDTARAVFPVENFGTVGLTSYVWEQIQADSPEAVWGEPSEDRPTPTVKFERSEQPRRIQPIRHGFAMNWYQLEQLAVARANGSPDLRIESRSLEEARLQILRLENRGLLFGNQPLGILGLLSQKVGTTDPVLTPDANVQGIPQVASPVAGKWLSEVFAGAEGTGEEMYDIITKAFTAIRDETEEVEMPDTIALGISDYININRKIFKGPNSDSTESVANVVLKNLKGIGLKAIVLLPELGYRPTWAAKLATKHATMNDPDPYALGNTYAQTYGGGLFQRNVMVCFKRDVEKSAIIVGHDLLVRPPLDMGDTKQTTVWLFSGGFLVRKPRSLRIVVAPSAP